MYQKGRYPLAIFYMAVTALFVALSFTFAYASQIDIIGPPGSGAFGTSVVVLSNGNIVVTDPTFDLSNPTVADVGAVYLCDGMTGALISVITGSTANDRVGNEGITALINGDYLIASASSDGVGVTNAGAATCIAE